MTMVTRQNLLAEKFRFLISVMGVAFSVFLISILLSLFQGWQLVVGRFVEEVDADVWVARQGTTEFLNAASILPATMQAELADLPDVDGVDAMIVRPMSLEVVGKGQETTHLVGYDIKGRAGGPLTIEEGPSVPGQGEVIIDKAFARSAGLKIGDELETGGQRLEVVGTSTGGDFVFSQTSFVSLDTARTLLGMDGLSTFYLLHVAEGANPETVAANVEENFPDVVAFTGDEFAAATREENLGDMVPILAVIVLLAFVVGVAITGLTIYNATVEKAREFGILKAIGFTNSYLVRLVLEQSLAMGLLGFVIGVGLTIVGGPLLSNLVPQFVTLVRWQDILLVFGMTVVMSIIAALLPVRRIASVDPVAVFQA